MSTFETVQKITSFRDCNDEVIPRKVLGQILEAGRNAPSPGNVNVIEFIVVEDNDKLETIADLTGDMRVSKAPTSIIVIGNFARTRRRFGKEHSLSATYSETACSVQNMRLVGAEHDISSVWLSGFDENMLGEIMNIPEGKRPVSVISFGFTDNPVPLEQKFGMNEICFYDSYGSQVASVFDGFEWNGIREEKRIYSKKTKGFWRKLKDFFD